MATLTDDGQLRRRALIDPAACRAAVDRLDELRADWIPRGSAFFTLGAATYLDVCGGDGGLAQYARRRDRCNAVLRERFGDLLDTVRDGLEAITAAPVRFDERELALPGFHVFLAASLHQSMRDNLHLDLQYSYLPLSADLFTPTLTFTLPLEIPAGGAGIEFCMREGRDPRGRITTESYVIGELLVHSGRALHRRAHRPATDRCRRVTLQGHGLLMDGTWVLYW
jgi:hypothetical protein